MTGSADSVSSDRPTAPRRRRRRARIIIAVLATFAALLVTNVVITLVRLSRHFGFDTQRSGFSGLLAYPGLRLEGAAEDRINILLAGLR